MAGWFGPGPGNNVRYYNGALGINFSIMPVSWQGWLTTAVYGLMQIGLAFAGLKLGNALHSPFLSVLTLVAMVFLHVAFLWFASRHYVSFEETDPSMLPVDERPPQARN